jgi:hypothetical protein
VRDVAEEKKDALLHSWRKAFHEMNAHNAQTMQHCLANVAASTTDLKHAVTIKDTAAAIGPTASTGTKSGSPALAPWAHIM